MVETKILKIIKVRKLSDGSCGFYCKYCKRLHIHGMANGHPNGTRVSHCNNPKSPYYGKEYYIELEEEKKK